MTFEQFVEHNINKQGNVYGKYTFEDIKRLLGENHIKLEKGIYDKTHTKARKKGIMKTFYFNTGVKPCTIHNPEFAYDYHKKAGHTIKNGTLQIPFDCEAPDNAKLLFLCDNPSLPQAQSEGVVVCKIFNTTMISSYAYFLI